MHVQLCLLVASSVQLCQETSEIRLHTDGVAMIASLFGCYLRRNFKTKQQPIRYITQISVELSHHYEIFQVESQTLLERGKSSAREERRLFTEATTASWYPPRDSYRLRTGIETTGYCPSLSSETKPLCKKMFC